MACGGKDPKTTKAVLEEIIEFVSGNLEKTEFFIHTKEKGEEDLKITLKLRAAISDTNASTIETLKRDIEGLKKPGKRVIKKK